MTTHLLIGMYIILLKFFGFYFSFIVHLGPINFLIMQCGLVILSMKFVSGGPTKCLFQEGNTGPKQEPSAWSIQRVSGKFCEAGAKWRTGDVSGQGTG